MKMRQNGNLFQIGLIILTEELLGIILGAPMCARELRNQSGVND